MPANKCGLVIGKGGESIRQMKEQSGAHIEMNKHAPHDAPTKAFTLRFITLTDEEIPSKFCFMIQILCGILKIIMIYLQRHPATD